jgi:hypothetical protein
MTEPDGPLMELLLEETGNILQVVVHHGVDSWDIVYVHEAAREQAETWEANFGELMDQFRNDADANRQREEVFDAGAYYCSLHLFEEVLIIQFNRPAGDGMLFRYDPDAAPNLTSFVELCLPHIDEQFEVYALDEN